MRYLLKRLILLACFIPVVPLIIMARFGMLCKNESLFYTFACALSIFPGKIGSFLRVAFYIGTLRKFSPDSSVGFGSFFTKSDAEVGKNVSIGAYCIIGSVRIRDNVLIASRVSIPSGRFQHGNGATFHDAFEKGVYQKIIIGSDSWIGESALVMADIGDGSIIGGGSVVVNPVADFSVAVGNPAKTVKGRDEEAVGG